MIYISISESGIIPTKSHDLVKMSRPSSELSPPFFYTITYCVWDIVYKSPGSAYLKFPNTYPKIKKLKLISIDEFL